METSGYSPYLLLGVIIFGCLLILVRPYWCFLLAIFLFAALNLNLAINTRTQYLGPYFNLYDALFVIALLSIIRDSESSPLIIPRPVEWILIVLILGVIQTLFYYQMNNMILRGLRWSVTFPLAFFLGANAVVTQDRAKPFLYAMIIGATLNAILSFIDYKGLALLHPADPALRMAGAGNFLGVSLLVAASQRAFFPTNSLAVKILWGVALIFLALTILFGQWRSVFLGVILSMICLPVILNRWKSFIRGFMLVLIGMPLLLITLQVTLPSISTSHMLQRFALVTNYLSLSKGIPKDDATRWRQINRDLEEWSQGNWLIGRGLGFNAFLPDGFDPSIAWGHVGYTSYLSQFGLIGLIIFAIYLPLQILRAGREVYFARRDGPTTNLGLLTIVSVVLVSVICFMSTSYLSLTMHSTGFLYGAVWSLAYRQTGAAAMPPVLHR
jgi:hypothetical protein